PHTRSLPSWSAACFRSRFREPRSPTNTPSQRPPRRRRPIERPTLREQRSTTKRRRPQNCRAPPPSTARLQGLQLLGLPVRVGVPAEERALLDLYPQPRGRESAVEYVLGRPLPPGLPPGRDVPRWRRVKSSHDPRGMHRLRLRPVPVPGLQQQEVARANEDRGRPPPSQGGDLPQRVAALGRRPAYHGTS